MAPKSKKTPRKQSRNRTVSNEIDEDVSVPSGFTEISGRLDGWFVRERGNQVVGELVDMFEIDGKYGPRNVFKITITQGKTRVNNADNEIIEVGAGKTIGLDETGFLQSMSELSNGTIVWVYCQGKMPPTEEYPQGSWRFKTAVQGAGDAKSGRGGRGGRGARGGQRRAPGRQRRDNGPASDPRTATDDDIPFGRSTRVDME